MNLAISIFPTVKFNLDCMHQFMVDFPRARSPLRALISLHLTCNQRKSLVLRKTGRGNSPNSRGKGEWNHSSNFSISGEINFGVFFQHDGEVSVYSHKLNSNK